MSGRPAQRWGVTLPLDSVPLWRHRAAVERLEELGYSDVWSSEASGADAFTPLAMTAAWSATLRLGTAIAPVYTRGPGLLAMSAAALADAAPGRFVLGVGASTPIIVERWNATAFREPYRRTRDTVRFLKRALAGERVDEQFDTFAVRGFRVDRAPDVPPPILVAALRPGMLRLGVTEADGVISNCLAASDVPRVVAELGPEGAGKEVVARIFVCPTGDSAHARRLGRRLISTYLTVPVYTTIRKSTSSHLGQTIPAPQSPVSPVMESSRRAASSVSSSAARVSRSTAPAWRLLRIDALSSGEPGGMHRGNRLQRSQQVTSTGR